MQDSLLDANTASVNVARIASPARSPLRWLLVSALALNLFCNHWSRDSFGALEVPIESDGNLTVAQYNSLSSAYFVPNVFVPAIAGVVAQLEPRKSGAWTFLAFSILAAIGNSVVVWAALKSQSTEALYVRLLAGRLLTGTAYEALDFLPTGMVAHRFPDHWGKLVGVVNGFNRLGSILNFLSAPLLYQSFGLRTALMVPSAVGACCLLTGTLMHQTDIRLARWEAREADADAAPKPPPQPPPLPSPGSHRDEDSTPVDGHAPATGPATSTGTADTTGAVDAADAADAAASIWSDVLLNPTYGLYVCGAMCVYGAVVPFWFIGAKVLQTRFGIGLSEADAYVLLPEGTILVVGPAIGVLTDRLHLRLRALLLFAAVALALVPVSLLVLAWLPLPRAAVLPAMVCLGVGYAAAQNLVWTMLPHVLKQEVLLLGAGVMACSLNLLPALLPVVAFRGDPRFDLSVLAAVGGVGMLALVLAAGTRRARAGTAMRHDRESE